MDSLLTTYADNFVWNFQTVIGLGSVNLSFFFFYNVKNYIYDKIGLAWEIIRYYIHLYFRSYIIPLDVPVRTVKASVLHHTWWSPSISLWLQSVAKAFVVYPVAPGPDTAYTGFILSSNRDHKGLTKPAIWPTTVQCAQRG